MQNENNLDHGPLKLQMVRANHLPVDLISHEVIRLIARQPRVRLKQAMLAYLPAFFLKPSTDAST